MVDGVQSTCDFHHELDLFLGVPCTGVLLANIRGLPNAPPAHRVNSRVCFLLWATRAILVLDLLRRDLCSILPRAPPILFGVSPAVLPRPGYWPAKVGRHDTHDRRSTTVAA